MALPELLLAPVLLPLNEDWLTLVVVDKYGVLRSKAGEKKNSPRSHSKSELLYDFCFKKERTCEYKDALRNLVPFAKFKKREKHPWRMFSTFLKFCRWKEIAQSITYKETSWYKSIFLSSSYSSRLWFATMKVLDDRVNRKVTLQQAPRKPGSWLFYRFQMVSLQI